MERLTAAEHKMVYNIFLYWLNSFESGFREGGHNKTQVKKAFSAFRKILGIPKITDEYVDQWMDEFTVYKDQETGEVYIK